MFHSCINFLKYELSQNGLMLLFMFSDDELIYLDPHTTQSAVDSEMGLGGGDQSYHCQRSPHRMKISSLDPSVALVRLQSQNH